MNDARSESIVAPARPRFASRLQPRIRAFAGVDDLLLLAIGIASGVAWFALYRWYGLLANRDNTHFAFEKIPGGWDSPILRRTALLFLALTAGYALTAWLIATAPRVTATAKGILIASALGAAIGNVLLYPVGALDVFNYMVELKLAFHFDQNPYLVTFVNYRADPFALPAFLVDVRLFYGPAWLLFSAVPGLVAGYSSVIRLLVALKIFNVALIAATGWLIASRQVESQRRWLVWFLFAANPLVLFEGVANGHNDVMMTCLLIAAVVLLERRSPLAGPALALSVMVKFYPLVLMPFFVLIVLTRHWGWRRLGLTLALTVATVVATVAPFWAGGDMPGGLRRGLDQSQEMDHVSVSSLVKQWEQQRIAARSLEPEWVKSRPSAEILSSAFNDRLRDISVVAITVLLIALLAAVRRGYPVERASAEALMVFFLLFTNLYPWYLIPVLALLAIRLDRLSRAYLFAATGLALVYYPMYVYGHFNSGMERFHVHLFLALFLTVPILVYLTLRLFSVFALDGPAGPRRQRAAGEG